MQTVHLVQHTHWDREWYFTENDSRAILYYFMEDLLNRLEVDETLGPFVLDGQTVMLEDYFDIAPENYDRVRLLIQSGRIEIGPWYTQTDFLVVGSESIARNLLLGKADCDAFESCMKIGYVPDSFGQSAQLPMYLAQFAIEHAVIWRGWSEYDVPQTEFIWRSTDGSAVTTAVLPWGYGCAKWLPTEVDAAWNSLSSILEKQGRFSQSQQILLPNGNDQSPFEYAVPGVLEQLNGHQQIYRFERSDFSRYFSALCDEGSLLPEYTGELLSPKYMRIHRGIFSTRMDIKLANAKLEQFLSQRLEPLLSVMWRLGLSYPQHAVNGIWREAMKSHAHDSIGCCNADRVNEMVKARLTSGQEMATQLFELNMKMLAEGIKAKQEGKKLIIFNPLPRTRNGIVSITLYTPAASFRILDEDGTPCSWEIISEEMQDMSVIVQELSNSSTPVFYRKCQIHLDVKNIPACGYTTLVLQEGQEAGFNMVEEKITALENPWLRLTLEQGKIVLFDKRNQQTYTDMLRLVDGGDAGDTYNYSPPADDWRVCSEGALKTSRWQRLSLSDRVDLSFQIAVPQNLDCRNNRDVKAILDVSMVITLPHHKPILDVEVSIHNATHDHRLQVEIPTNTQETYHYADQPFGLIRRDNTPSSMAHWEQEQWTEAPAALWPMQSLVMMHDEQKGMAVVTEGLREYEISSTAENTLAVTLLRSVGWLGRANMPWRPGRASGMVLSSPDSQMIGVHHCHIALIPMSAGQDESFWQEVEAWRTPAIAWFDSGSSRFKTNPHAHSFPSSHSLLTWDTPLHFSTLKKAQVGDELILRGWNPRLCSQEHITPVVSSAATLVTLAETPAPERGVEVPPCCPVTWKIA
jgi:mannosylglycerate hydrolase